MKLAGSTKVVLWMRQTVFSETAHKKQLFEKKVAKI